MNDFERITYQGIIILDNCLPDISLGQIIYYCIFFISYVLYYFLINKQNFIDNLSIILIIIGGMLLIKFFLNYLKNFAESQLILAYKTKIITNYNKLKILKTFTIPLIFLIINLIILFKDRNHEIYKKFSIYKIYLLLIGLNILYFTLVIYNLFTGINNVLCRLLNILLFFIITLPLLYIFPFLFIDNINKEILSSSIIFYFFSFFLVVFYLTIFEDTITTFNKVNNFSELTKEEKDKFKDDIFVYDENIYDNLFFTNIKTINHTYIEIINKINKNANYINYKYKKYEDEKLDVEKLDLSQPIFIELFYYPPKQIRKFLYLLNKKKVHAVIKINLKPNILDKQE